MAPALVRPKPGLLLRGVGTAEDEVARMAGGAVVGARVAVLWPNDQQYYKVRSKAPILGGFLLKALQASCKVCNGRFSSRAVRQPAWLPHSRCRILVPLLAHPSAYPPTQVHP